MCKICGRTSCTESFHRIEEQEEWQSVEDMCERELRSEVIDLRRELKDKNKEIDCLKSELESKEI
jgi:predicted RNase H-like nuclease (RuvC/YqgF family)